MRRSVPLATVFGLLLLSGTAIAAMAHEGDGEAKIEVEPSTVTAGESVILVGSGLEPDSDRVLVLAGESLIVEFDTVKTDADGRFQTELTIPGHLPAGAYELRAIGDETLTVALGVLAAEGATSPAPTATPEAGATQAPGATTTPGGAVGPAATATPVDPTKSIVPRERSTLDLALIVGFVVIAGGLGGLLIWRAERFRGSATSWRSARDSRSADDPAPVGRDRPQRSQPGINRSSSGIQVDPLNSEHAGPPADAAARCRDPSRGRPGAGGRGDDDDRDVGHGRRGCASPGCGCARRAGHRPGALPWRADLTVRDQSARVRLDRVGTFAARRRHQLTVPSC